MSSPIRCPSLEVLKGHRAVDSQGDLRLHWRADGDAGQAEKGDMGTVFTSGGKVEQVRGGGLRSSRHILNTMTY